MFEKANRLQDPENRITPGRPSPIFWDAKDFADAAAKS